MSTLNISNGNISNNTTISNLTVNGVAISNSITVGSVTVSNSQITVGSSLVNSSVVSVPSLILSGTSITGTVYGGIVNTQIFTANGTWTNPTANATLGLTGYEQVLVMMWGAGGSGSSGAAERGGGGGACGIFMYKASDLGSTVSVTVGEGAAGASGGNTSFGSLTVYGGGRESSNAGGGGGLLSQGSNGASNSAGGGLPLGGQGSLNPGGTSTFGGGGGGGGGGAAGGASIFGGGGGGDESSGVGGLSIYGGGGGGGAAARAISVFGGFGGNNTTAASIPAGGGGGNASGLNIAGGRGEVRVWTISSTAPVQTSNSSYVYNGLNEVYASSSTTEQTFTNISVGTADASRLLVLSVSGMVYDYSYSMTVYVNGVAATKIGRSYYSPTYDYYADEIWAIPLPTGTTANVTIDSGYYFYGSGLAVATHSLYNLSSQTPVEVKENGIGSNSVLFSSTKYGDIVVAIGATDSTYPTTYWTGDMANTGGANNWTTSSGYSHYYQAQGAILRLANNKSTISYSHSDGDLQLWSVHALWR